MVVGYIISCYAWCTGPHAQIGTTSAVHRSSTPTIDLAAAFWQLGSTLGTQLQHRARQTKPQVCKLRQQVYNRPWNLVLDESLAPHSRRHWPCRRSSHVMALEYGLPTLHLVLEPTTPYSTGAAEAVPWSATFTQRYSCRTASSPASVRCACLHNKQHASAYSAKHTPSRSSCTKPSVSHQYTHDCIALSLCICPAMWLHIHQISI